MTACHCLQPVPTAADAGVLLLGLCREHAAACTDRALPLLLHLCRLLLLLLAGRRSRHLQHLHLQLLTLPAPLLGVMPTLRGFLL
jgi:hypothetical protein